MVGFDRTSHRQCADDLGVQQARGLQVRGPWASQFLILVRQVAWLAGVEFLFPVEF